MMNILFKLQKKNFSHVPRIKFVGNRKTLSVANHEPIGKTVTQEITKKTDSKSTESKSYSVLNREFPRSLGTFQKSFDRLNTDFDIYRDTITEKEIETVNLAYAEVDDWRKIKYI